jgi:hypothetical protein
MAVLLAAALLIHWSARWLASERRRRVLAARDALSPALLERERGLALRGKSGPDWAAGNGVPVLLAEERLVGNLYEGISQIEQLVYGSEAPSNNTTIKRTYSQAVRDVQRWVPF